MTEKEKHLIEVYLTEKNNDIKKRIENFESITNSLFVLTQSLFDNKEIVKYHQREIEGKYFRFGISNYSLINLMRGNHFTLINQKASIIDIFSLNSITRMQIESFLIMFYIFFDKINDSEKDFRYSIYKLHGLQKQSNFKISSDFPNKKIQLDKIKIEMNEVIENIKKSKNYNDADEKEQKKYLKPTHAKLVKNEILFKESGIENNRINDIWQIYSNHVHAEHISDRQFNSYRISNFKNDNSSLIINLNLILTTKLIWHLINSFDSVKKKYEQMSEKEKVHIKIWKSL